MLRSALLPLMKAGPSMVSKRSFADGSKLFFLGAFSGGYIKKIVVQNAYENIIREYNQSWRKNDH